LFHRLDIGVGLFETFFQLLQADLFRIIDYTVDFAQSPPAFLNGNNTWLPFQGSSADVVSLHHKGSVGSVLRCSSASWGRRKGIQTQQ
jgi:hypothetical protein